MPFFKNRRPMKKQGASAGPAKPMKKGAKKRPAKKVTRKKIVKPAIPSIENTGREALYLEQLIKQEKVVAVVLNSGETLHGYVRYYDKDVFSLGPIDGGPKIFLRKESVRYLYEE